METLNEAGETWDDDYSQDDPLNVLVEEIMDLARENPIDDARVFIRDRIVKDAERAIRMSHCEQ